MKQFIAFIRKEFYHILRDRRTMLILIGMPVVQIILFGFAISTEVRDVKTAVLISSSFPDCQKMVERLDASEYFSVEYVVHSPREIQELMKKNRIELAVCFSDNLHQADFRSYPVQVIADATDPNQAVSRSSYATAILLQAIGSMKTASSPTTLQATPPVTLYSKLLYNPQMKSAYQFVPGVMGLILMLLCAMMTSVSIVREKETGTMEVLLVSPMPPLGIILAKSVPYLILSLVNLATILILSVYVLDVPIAGSLTALIAVSLLFIFVSLALGLFISCLTHTQIAALLISAMVLMLPTILLCGIIFPIESMPLLLQGLSCLIPARWYVDIVRRLMIEGVPISYLWQEISILILIGIALIALTTRKFNDRLE